jgi:Mn2+/Fe2+ NRAMP family transporter
LRLQNLLRVFGKHRQRQGTPQDRGKVVRFPERGDLSQSRELLSRIVPGVIAGAADLDPAAALTATVAGATYGLSVAWVVILCFPIIQSVLGVSARIGHETRLGLVKLIRENFGLAIAIAVACMIVAVNVLMIIGDVMAVSDAFSIVLLQPARFFPAAVAFTIWVILIKVGYDRVTTILASVAMFQVAYIAAAGLATDSGHALVSGIFMPRFAHGTGYVMAVIAVFGSLLTPDVIVWQTSSKREGGVAFHTDESRYGCIVAVFISLSAIIASSHMQVTNLGVMTTRQAAQTLAPLGELGPVLFAIGIIGSGFVALPILVSSLCFSVAEAAGWDYGFTKEPWEAQRFYVLICIVLFLAVVVNYFGINTVKTLYWSQVLAGVFIVPILFFILWIANDRRLMQTTNSVWDNFWLGGAVGGMITANAIFFWLGIIR